jgi:hypothetical protein
MLFNDFFLFIIYCSALLFLKTQNRDKIVNCDMMMPLLRAGSLHIRTSPRNNNHIGGESFPTIILDICHVNACGVY